MRNMNRPRPIANMTPTWPDPGSRTSCAKYPTATKRAIMPLTSRAERTRFLRTSSNISALEAHLGGAALFRAPQLPVRFFGEIEKSGDRHRRGGLSGNVLLHSAFFLRT